MCQALEIAFIQSHHQTQLVVVDPATKEGQFSTTLLINIYINILKNIFYYSVAIKKEASQRLKPKEALLPPPRFALRPSPVVGRLPPEGGARTYLCPAGLIYARLDLFMAAWTYLCPAGAKLDHDFDYKR